MAHISVDISRDAEDEPSGRPPRHPNTCPQCRSHYRDDELRDNLRVCPHCGYHFPVGARERIDQLVDEGTWVESAAELRSADPLAFVDLRAYVDRLAEAELATGLGDALVVGTGAIGGHGAALAVMDFAFLAGSMGSVVGEKFAIAADLACANGVPLVSVSASGGARMQENILALMQMAKTVLALDALRDARLPYISVIANPSTGGVIASFAALGDVALAEPAALMSFAGPRVVRQTTRETLPADFGLAEPNLRLGHVDEIVPRTELKPRLAQLLALLARGPEEEEPAAAAPEERNGAGPLSRLRRLLRGRGPDGQGH